MKCPVCGKEMHYEPGQSGLWGEEPLAPVYWCDDGHDEYSERASDPKADQAELAFERSRGN